MSKTKRRVTEEHTLEVSRSDLLEALRDKFPEIPDTGVVAYFNVPSGGDYSGDTLLLEDDTILVRWTTYSET